MKQMQYKSAFKRHRDKAYGYAFMLLKNQEDAEDVTQEVFVNLWRHWMNIDRKKMEAWIMRSIRNRSIDVIRKRRTPLAKVQDIQWESVAFSGDDALSPLALLERTETQDSVLRILYTLPEKIQSILLLYYYQGMKLTAIGDVLDVNLNTVKVTLHRGRKMLKEALKKHCPDVVEGF